MFKLIADGLNRGTFTSACGARRFAVQSGFTHYTIARA